MAQNKFINCMRSTDKGAGAKEFLVKNGLFRPNMLQIIYPLKIEKFSC